MVSTSGPTAIAGAVAAPETGGTSLVVTAGAAGEALAGTAMQAGAAKNAAAIGLAMYKAGADFSSKTKKDAKAAVDGKCQNCGVETSPGQKSQKGVTPPGTEGQTDHFIPKSKGGTNEPSNARHLCRDCNLKNSNKMPNQQ
jgi:hypothetical protein